MNSMFLVSVLSMAGADAPVVAPAPLPIALPVYSAPAMAAPIVVGGGAGCSNCGSSAPSYGGVTYAPSYSTYGSSSSACCSNSGGFGFGILDRVRGRFASIGSRFAPSHRGGSCCPAPVATCAPACAAPVATCSSDCGNTYAPVSTPLVGHALFTGMTSNVCDPCGRKGLLDRLHGIFRRPTWGAGSTSGIVGGTGCCGSTTSGYGDVVGTPVYAAPAVPAPEYMPAPAPVGIPTPMPPKEMPKPMPMKTEPTPGPKTTQLTPKSPVIPTLGGTAGNY